MASHDEKEDTVNLLIAVIKQQFLWLSFRASFHSVDTVARVTLYQAENVGQINKGIPAKLQFHNKLE